MFSRFTRMTFLAAAASLLLSGPLAVAQDASDKDFNDEPSCSDLQESALRVPDWYAERCLGGVVPELLAPQSDPELVPGDTAVYCSLFSPNARTNPQSC